MGGPTGGEVMDARAKAGCGRRGVLAWDAWGREGGDCDGSCGDWAVR